MCFGESWGILQTDVSFNYVLIVPVLDLYWKPAMDMHLVPFLLFIVGIFVLAVVVLIFSL